MRSSVETVVAYEMARLRGKGYGVAVSPMYSLPMDRQLGNDVVVGVLAVKVDGDANPAELTLCTEGLAVGGSALQEGATVVLRRRVWFSMEPGTIKLTDAVRLHPYVEGPTDKGKAQK